MLSKPSPQYYPTYHVLHCRSSQLSCMSMSSLYWGVQNWMLHPDVVLWDSSNSCFTASWGQPRSQSASWAAGFPAETLSLLPTRIPSAFASELFPGLPTPACIASLLPDMDRPPSAHFSTLLTALLFTVTEFSTQFIVHLFCLYVAILNMRISQETVPKALPNLR